MIEYYKKVVFENYANFTGRARRAEYWYYALASIIISILLSIIDSIFGFNYSDSANSGIIKSIYTILVFIPGLAVSVRRMHDIGKSGWIIAIYYAVVLIFVVMMFLSGLAFLVGGGGFSFIIFIPILIFLAASIYLLILFCKEGDQGPNKYGPDPKEMVQDFS